MADEWESLPEEQRGALVAGDEAMHRLRHNDTLADWLKVGVASDSLQAAAMTAAGTDTPHGARYRAAWSSLASHTPLLRELDKGTRSQAIWLARNWPDIDLWLGTQAQNVRLTINHPGVVKRKYESSHRPPDGTEQKKTKRVQLQDQVVRLQEENDALKKGRTQRGSVLLMPNDTPATAADKLADEHNAEWLQKLQRELEKRVKELARNEAIEGKRQKPPRKSAKPNLTVVSSDGEITPEAH